jgi:chitodextrinase
VNNLVVGQPNPGARLNNFANSGIPFAPNTLSSDYFSALDYNAYYHKSNQNLYLWGSTDGIKTTAALNTLIAPTGQKWDVNAIQVTDSLKAPDPFIDRAGQDFRLKADSLAATNKGKALPADVAAAIGVPAGTVPVRGVIFPATSLPTTTTTVTPTTTTTVTPAPVNQPPVGPTALTGFGSSTTQINLTWPAATDDSAVKNYLLTRNGTQVYSGTALSFNDTGLVAGTTYQYKIVAVDAAGLSSTGATAAVKTMETPLPPADSLPPTAPTNVKAGLSFNATRFSYDNILKWTASTDTGGSGMQDYLVRRNGSDLGTTVSADIYR